jgi:hypothetical protein
MNVYTVTVRYRFLEFGEEHFAVVAEDEQAAESSVLQDVGENYHPPKDTIMVKKICAASSDSVPAVTYCGGHVE